jgi:hypothetical protein
MNNPCRFEFYFAAQLILYGTGVDHLLDSQSHRAPSFEEIYTRNAVVGSSRQLVSIINSKHDLPMAAEVRLKFELANTLPVIWNFSSRYLKVVEPYRRNCPASKDT